MIKFCTKEDKMKLLTALIFEGTYEMLIKGLDVFKRIFKTSPRNYRSNFFCSLLDPRYFS